MTRQQLIRLIHIAKTQLNLDDETYRAKLAAIAKGKTSCAQMSVPQLMAVYDAFVENGFKRRFIRSKQPMRPTKEPASITDKIRAVWITMHRQGLIQNDSEQALNSFVQRQTIQLNKGIGVAAIGWLDDRLATRVLESLKQWHKRLMLAALRAAGHSSTSDMSYAVACTRYRHITTMR